MLLNAKLHRDNSLLMHDFIPAFKANAIHMIGEMIVDYLEAKVVVVVVYIEHCCFSVEIQLKHTRL